MSKDANEWILSHCYYCKNCSEYAINSKLQKELKRNHFKTKNKHIKWWKICFLDALPVLEAVRWTILIFLIIYFWCLYAWDWRELSVRGIFFFLAQNLINRTLENANMLLLSKEATDKDRSLKTQLLVTSNDGQEKLSGEKFGRITVFSRLEA